MSSLRHLDELVVVKQKTQQNQRKAILLTGKLLNSCIHSLQNPMVRSAYKLLAWKLNNNSLILSILFWFPKVAPSDALDNPTC